MEDVGVFHGHLEYFTAIRYILWPFGNFVVIWYNFPRFGILCREKSGNPVCTAEPASRDRNRAKSELMAAIVLQRIIIIMKLASLGQEIDSLLHRWN
jgi:hypothetical protein